MDYAFALFILWNNNKHVASVCSLSAAAAASTTTDTTIYFFCLTILFTFVELFQVWLGLLGALFCLPYPLLSQPAASKLCKKNRYSSSVLLYLLLVIVRHCSRVPTPGYIPKKRSGFFGYTHLKKPTPKNPHFYFNLILVYTLYATNNAIFHCFKAFKALS